MELNCQFCKYIEEEECEPISNEGNVEDVPTG